MRARLRVCRVGALYGQQGCGSFAHQRTTAGDAGDDGETDAGDETTKKIRKNGRQTKCGGWFAHTQAREAPLFHEKKSAQAIHTYGTRAAVVISHFDPTARCVHVRTYISLLREFHSGAVAFCCQKKWGAGFWRRWRRAKNDMCTENIKIKRRLGGGLCRGGSRESRREKQKKSSLPVTRERCSTCVRIPSTTAYPSPSASSPHREHRKFSTLKSSQTTCSPISFRSGTERTQPGSG